MRSKKIIFIFDFLTSSLKSSRRRRNSIKCLMSIDGTWKTNPQDMKQVIEEYFSQISHSGSLQDMDDALLGLSRVVTEDMNACLDQEPTESEIKEALFQMHPTKAPGPDGIHALFYKNFWSIVEQDVVDLMKNWWRGWISLGGINKTCITLIPKCKDLKLMTEFRPISCCNVIYKIISKVMANKLKPFLGHIISPNRTDFIPKCLITDLLLLLLKPYIP